MTTLNFGWHFYFSMLALVTLWNCGLVAITRKGKIGYFILEYFERTKLKQEKFPAEFSRNFDEQLYAELNLAHDPEWSRKAGDLVWANKISKCMESSHLFSETSPEGILSNLRQHIPNIYYYLKEERIISPHISDPIITCVTCMASLHSLIIYTLVIFFKGYHWNFFEWAAIAIPCAFLGEFLWKLKSKLESDAD